MTATPAATSDMDQLDQLDTRSDQERNGRPFRIAGLRAALLSKQRWLTPLAQRRVLGPGADPAGRPLRRRRLL